MWQTFPIQFKGGLISNLSPLQHGMTSIGSGAILQNFEPSLSGGYKKVLGYEKLINAEVTGSGTVQGIAAVDSSKVIAVRDGTYYEADSSSGTPVWTSLATASNTSFTKTRKEVYNFTGTEKIVFTDGLNYPAYYESGSLTFLTGSGIGESNVAGASVALLYKSTLFFAVGTELVFTAPYDDTNFNPADGAGVINVASTITGLAVYRDNLIIFCADRILKLVGSSSADFSLSSLTSALGCLETDSIREVGGDVMFLAPDGLRTLSSTERIGDFGLDVASKPIKNTLDELLKGTVSVHSYVIRKKGQYRLFVYSNNIRDSVSKGLIATKFIDQGGEGFQWATLKGFKVHVADSILVGDVELIYFVNDDGYVYKQEVGSTRDSSSIEAIYESAFMPISDPQIRKTFYKLDTYIKPEGSFTCDVSLKLDRNEPNVIQPQPVTLSGSGGGFVYGDAGSVFGTALYSTPGDQTFFNNIIGSGTTVALRIEDNSTNASFTLDTAVLEFSTNERR